MKHKDLLEIPLGLQRRGIRQPPMNGDFFGVELENEAEGIFNHLSIDHASYRNNFRLERDGSLRGDGPFEFVSRPLNLDDLEKAVFCLCDELKGIKWSCSRRTSTHVHINFSDRTALDLSKFLAIYWIFEKVLLLTVRETRIDNTFCYPSIDTRDELIRLVSLEPMQLNFLNRPDRLKYSSMNIATLSTIGTVECRIFNGTMSPDLIMFWVKILNSMLVLSRGYNSLKEILEDFNKTPATEFIHKVFSKDHYKILSKSAKKRGTTPEDELRDGFRYAVPVFKLDKVFNAARVAMNEEKNKMKHLKEIAETDKTFDNLLEELLGGV